MRNLRLAVVSKLLKPQNQEWLVARNVCNIVLAKYRQNLNTYELEQYIYKIEYHVSVKRRGSMSTGC